MQSSSSWGRIAGVGIMFVSNGAIFSALLPWYPLLTRQLELAAAEFGVIVACFAVGALLSSALPAPLIARFGPVRVAVVGTVALAAAVAVGGSSGTGWMLAIAIFCAGFSDAVVDVAQNVAGLRVQTAVGRPILGSMHAFWSLGAAGSGAAATVAASNGVDIRVYLGVAGVVGVALVTVGGVLSRTTAPALAPESDGERPKARWRTIGAMLAPLVAIAICGMMVEDVANNWAALSAVELTGYAPAGAGIAFTIVIASQCIGRFSGDALVHRFGRAIVGRVGGSLIALGGIAVVVSTEPVLLFVGLALAGYGSATLVPSAFSAADEVPGIAEGTGVTLVSWLMRFAYLVTSPVIGLLADAFSLRVGLALLVLAGVTAVFLGGVLRERPAGEARVRS